LRLVDGPYGAGVNKPVSNQNGRPLKERSGSTAVATRTINISSLTGTPERVSLSKAAFRIVTSEPSGGSEDFINGHQYAREGQSHVETVADVLRIVHVEKDRKIHEEA
jgi:hypothetical protein